MKTSLVSIKTFTWNLPGCGRLAAVLLALAALTAQAHWPNTNATKFVQMPDITINGIDVNSSGQLWVADDFLCTNTGPILDIHLWCSWFNDQADSATIFNLSIWTDVPVSATNSFSHPGTMLWSMPFAPGQYEMLPVFNSNERFLYPGQGVVGQDNTIWQYNFYPPTGNQFTQTGSISAPVVYWLSVNAAPQSTSLWGWKTSTNHFNDYAVFGLTGPGNWQPITGPPGMPWNLDLAFALTTASQCPGPTISCTNRSVQCGAWAPVSPWAWDNCCNSKLTCTLISSQTNGACPWTVTLVWKATDCRGQTNLCAQTVTVADTLPPVVVCPQPVSYSAGTNCQLALPDLRALLTVTDCSACTITQTPAPGTILGLGTTNVTFALVDACGNSNGCVTAVQVNDTLPPVVNWPPGSLRLVTDTNCQAISLPDLLTNVQASDCSPPVTLTQSPAPGTALNLGTHPVTLTAVDAVHNTNTCVVSVVVVPPVPLITQQPACAIASQGGSATFSASAQSCASFSYQWSFNGHNIANATNSTYTVLAAGPANAGNYTAAAINSGGTAYTVRASLRLGDPAQHLIRNYTPAAWQASDVHWNRDVAPHNKVDDLIDASSDPTFDVMVNFNRCVQPDDMQMLAQIGNSNRVVMQSKYLSSVVMAALTKAEITNLAVLPGIAFIEKRSDFEGFLGVSVPSLCVIGGSASCAGNVHDTWGYEGTGVGIVIMDSGVDNAVCDTFANNRNINGYDEFTQQFVDPDDDHGHGTSVASIALGEGSGHVPRGVATNATLIDVRVLKNNPNNGKATGPSAGIMHALEVVYDNRVNWGVDIINMSFGSTDASGGTDAFSELVNLAESMGITVVAAAGNDGPNNDGFSTPAAATRAITVGAIDDWGTTSRADDTIAAFSNRGPRADDGNACKLDELKPEVVAPGMMTTTPYCWDLHGNVVNGIKCAMKDVQDDWACWEGTSQAAPHVSGVAALIKQASPGINAASVKQLLISTAEAKAGHGASQPLVDPIWNQDYGWGMVNAYAPLIALGATDVAFPNYPCNPSWMSPDLSVTPDPKVNQKSTVKATIKNKGPANASNVRVHFGIHDFSASIPNFYDIGTAVTDVANEATVTVQMDWTPKSSGHQCLVAEIGYGADSNFANNKAQRNLQIAQSPVCFQVRNTLIEGTAAIEFVPEFENPTQGWTVMINPTEVFLNSFQCPAIVEVLMVPPPGAAPGLTNRVHITAMIGTNVLGGVTVEDSTKILILPLQRNLDGSFTLAWTVSGQAGGGTLEWAPDITGPWTGLPGVGSPHTFMAAEPQRFYRVRYP